MANSSETSWIGIGALLLVSGVLAWSGSRPFEGSATASSAAALSATPDSVGIPQLVEPIGLVETPPLEFRWQPGGDDVDYTQLLIYRSDMLRLYTSGPLETNSATVPPYVYDTTGPGVPIFWRVREIRDGKARAASGFRKVFYRADFKGNVASQVALDNEIRKGEAFGSTAAPRDSTRASENTAVPDSTTRAS